MRFMHFILLVVFCVVAVSAQTLPLVDDFEDYDASEWTEGTVTGNWYVNFTGYGRVGVTVDESAASKVHFQKPKASTSPGETHASLVTSLANMGDFRARLKMKTVQQLRTPTPNAWEAAWVFWHYTDNTHFYYFILKPNGWELGKEDPTYPGNQRFLATGSTPILVLDRYNDIEIQQHGVEIKVSVDGMPVVAFSDAERPYWSGKFGLYNEDAYVFFDDVAVYADSTSSVGARKDRALHDYRLYQNYPNPFNPSTTVRYDLAGSGRVTLAVYNMHGERVRTLVDGEQKSGSHAVRWDGRDLNGDLVPSGMYLVKIKAGEFSAVNKMILLR